MFDLCPRASLVESSALLGSKYYLQIASTLVRFLMLPEAGGYRWRPFSRGVWVLRALWELLYSVWFVCLGVAEPLNVGWSDHSCSLFAVCVLGNRIVILCRYQGDPPRE